MCKVLILRALVKQRLTAAAEEIFVLFERTIKEYEEELSRSKEENERQQKLLDAVSNPHLQLHRADVQQVLVDKEEVLTEQQDWSSSLVQEDQEPPHIKEEPEEVWTSQEGEQLQGLEEAVITKFPFALVTVKSEEHEEKPQSSQRHQRPTEQMEVKSDGGDCGGSESSRNSDPDRHPEPDTDDRTGDSTGHETDNSDDWKETREPQAGVNSLLIDSRCTEEKRFSCSVCGKGYGSRRELKIHMTFHTGEKPFGCSVCKKSFTQSAHLRLHMRIHTGEKPFSCLVCSKAFSHSGHLKTHIRSHTGEKPFSCLICRKSFTQRGNLQLHMRIHTGEKPFACMVCSKAFSHSGDLKRHMRFHTGEKPFSCSVCDKAFSHGGHLNRHMRSHTGEKHFRASNQQTDGNRS